ncbi:MAG: hypothetical protein JWM68_3483, partial [Verrucomicrobiales bacterium]|nr:hypothetical protein [Verrucomicrobiales bacterium]
FSWNKEKLYGPDVTRVYNFRMFSRSFLIEGAREESGHSPNASARWEKYPPLRLLFQQEKETLSIWKVITVSLPSLVERIVVVGEYLCRNNIAPYALDGLLVQRRIRAVSRVFFHPTRKNYEHPSTFVSKTPAGCCPHIVGCRRGSIHILRFCQH